MIVGRTGQQPFAIEGSRVSQRHCEVKVENGEWTIRDLNSLNGTFIRDDRTGRYIPVSGSPTTITPHTFICLGETGGEGSAFYAWSLFHPDDYTSLVAHIREKEDEFEAEMRQIKRRVRRQKIMVMALNVLIIMVSFIDALDQVNKDLRMYLLRVVPLLTSAFAVFYDASDARERVKERRRQFRICPNPECHQEISGSDLRNHVCHHCNTPLP